VAALAVVEASEVVEAAEVAAEDGVEEAVGAGGNYDWKIGMMEYWNNGILRVSMGQFAIVPFQRFQHSKCLK
jgi:hypothetical protein